MRATRLLWNSLTLSRTLPLPLLPLPPATERSRRHRRAPSRPPPPPSLADALKGSASTPSSSPPIHGPPEALPRRPQARPQPSAAGELSRIRELQPLSGLAVASTGSAVSSSSIPPPPRARSRTLAALFTGADCSSPPAMAWPWPQPPQLAPEPTVVLTATSGGRSALPFPLLCTVAPFPPTPEVRQPLSSTPARITAALASPVCPVRCARAWAFRPAN